MIEQEEEMKRKVKREEKTILRRCSGVSGLCNKNAHV
jgi:hypothetical protein